MRTARPLINLVLLKSPPLHVPYVLDDIVLSVQSMLQRAGYPTVLSYNRIDLKLVNILFGIHMPGTASIAQIRAVSTPGNTIIFNSEQLKGPSHWITPEYLKLLRDYVCLDYNQANIDYLYNHTHDQSRMHEFPVLPSPSFRGDYPMQATSWDIEYDLAFYGSTANGGRIERLTELLNKGIRLKCFSGSYGSNLPMKILDCAAILNIHGYESALFEVGRCLRPTALGIPIFSDLSIHSGIVNWADSGIFFLPRSSFSNALPLLLHDSDRMLDASQRMLHFVNDPRWPILADHVMQQALQALDA